MASKMRTTTGKKSHRHRMVQLLLDRRAPEKTVRIPCPEPPRTEQEKTLAADLAKKPAILMNKDPAHCQRVFAYYLDNVWVNQGFLVFRDYLHPEPARDFLKFLEELGITKAQWKILSFDQAERSRFIPKWRTELGLAAVFPIIKFNDGKTRIKAKDWLAIMPVFVDDNKSRNSQPEAKGSNAFRYLMIMGAIVSAHQGGL